LHEPAVISITGASRVGAARKMPWTYTIDQERDAVLVTATGIVTGDELTAGAKTLAQDPGFHPDIRILLDYHAISELRVAYNVIETLASSRIYSEKSRRACYVQAGFGVGVGQYYQAFAQAGRVEVFTERAEALAWLNEGVPPEKTLV
jgi:hypothetical protein